MQGDTGVPGLLGRQGVPVRRQKVLDFLENCVGLKTKALTLFLVSF